MKNSVQLLLPYESKLITKKNQPSVDYLRIKRNLNNQMFDLVILNKGEIVEQVKSQSLTMRVAYLEESLIIDMKIKKINIQIECDNNILGAKYREYAEALRI